MNGIEIHVGMGNHAMYIWALKLATPSANINAPIRYIAWLQLMADIQATHKELWCM